MYMYIILYAHSSFKPFVKCMSLSLTLKIALSLILFCLSPFEFRHLCESSVWFPILYAVRLYYPILHRTSILLIKSELRYGRFTPLCNS